MAKIKEKLEWTNVNTDTMSGDLAKSYAKLRATFDAVKAAKATFEADFTKVYEKNVAKVPAGQRLVFSHLRGLAVAIASVDKPKATTGGLSLTA